MNKTWKVTIILLLVFSVIVNLLTLFNVNQYIKMEEMIYETTQKETAPKETTPSLEEQLDELDKQLAHGHFGYLKGQIDEIHVLSYNLEVPDEVLQRHLDDIVTSQNFECEKDSNHYISDFKFVTPDSSTVGELCNILRSQINDYILTI